jgi:hypothetical protein
MNLKLLAAAAVCSLTVVPAASAQTVYMNDTAYIEPAPTYVAPAYRTYFPGDIVAPQVMVVEPSVVAPSYTLQPGPRYGYNSGYYGVTYGSPRSCTINAFGYRVCE